MSSHPPFHLIATDMDGTLLNPDHEISVFAKSVLQQVVKENPYLVSVSLASGRLHKDLVFYLKQLELPPYAGFLISSNGARVHRLTHDPNGMTQLEEIYCGCINADIMVYLLRLVPDNDNEINVNLYQDERWRCTIDWKDQLVYFKLSGLQYELFSTKELLTAYEAWQKQPEHGVNPIAGVSKVYFGTESIERLQQLEERVRREQPSLVITFSSKYCMEINAPGVSKAHGISVLVQHLQQQCISAGVPAGNVPWSLEHCIVFGDGHNDEEMLKAAGKGCVMQNASESLKQRLPHLEVIGSNKEDAVAKKVQEIFQLKS